MNIDSPSSSTKTDLKFEIDNTTLSKSDKQNLNQLKLSRILHQVLMPLIQSVN